MLKLEALPYKVCISEVCTILKLTILPSLPVQRLVSSDGCKTTAECKVLVSEHKTAD